MTKSNKDPKTDDDSSSITSSIKLTNPFTQLLSESKKHEELYHTLLKDYNDVTTLSITLAQESEKFRNEALIYKNKHKELTKVNDELKSKWDYTEARYQMAKKWLKNEYNMREELESLLQQTEMERDQLKQIVQLCKELMLDEELEDGGSVEGTTISKAGVSNFSKRFSEAFQLHKDRDRERGRERERTGHLEEPQRHRRISDSSDACSEKMNNLIKKLDDFKIIEQNQLAGSGANNNRRTALLKNHYDNDKSKDFEGQTFDVTGEIINDVLSPGQAKREKARRKRRSRGNPGYAAPFPSQGYNTRRSLRDNFSLDLLDMVDGPDKSTSILVEPNTESSCLREGFFF